MSTNRPFFSNFLSAFRARSGFQKASTSPTGGVSGASLTKAQQAAAASTSTARTAASNTSTDTYNGTTTSTQSQNIPSAPIATVPSARKATTTTSPVSATGVTYQRHHHTTPYSRSPGTSPGPARGFRSGSISPSNNSGGAGRRRGSDSSSEGFREILGAEKWYIGGRTATGEERFYRLGMVRKPPSIDRLSADRLSL